MNDQSGRSFRFLSLAVIIVLVTGLFIQATPAAAQASGLTMKATAAYEGYFKYGEWLPVWVDLENTGADVKGEVRVQVPGSQYTMVFSAPVELPAGARKRVPVYVLPNNFSRQLDVRLVSQGNAQALANSTVSVRPQPNISYFIGFLAPERGALALLNGLTFPGQDRSKILVDLRLDELPEASEGLRSFDLLVINDTDTSKLTPAQASALAGWVQQGGRLVVGGGVGAQRSLAGLPAGLLPAQVTGTVDVSASQIQPLADFAGSAIAQSTGSLVAGRAEVKDGKLIAGDTNFPQIIERTSGSGAVDFVAFDLGGTPFNGWPGTVAFWSVLLGPGRAYPQNMPFDMSPRQYRANTLTYPLSNIPSLDLPSIRELALLLGLYIVVVGPVNYLVLRWRKRLHLAWVTIPAVTILFAAAAFGIGFAKRGNDLILNKIALVETKPDGNATVTSFMGLFSPRMQSYEVMVQGDSLISPMTGYEGNPWNAGPGPSQTSGGEMVFVQGQPSRVQGLTVNQWAMQSFMSEGSWSSYGSFTGSLHMENEALVGTLRNDTSYPMTDVVVVLQSRFARLGDMQPGEEKPVNIGMSNLQTDRFGSPLSYRLFQEHYTNGPLPREIEMKTNIISGVFENGPWGKMAASSAWPMGGNSAYNNGGVLVFGWSDQAPPVVEVAGNRLTQRTTALVYSLLDYTYPENGYLDLPPGFVPGTMTKNPVNGGMCGSPTSVQMNRGQAEFEFTVPNNLKGYQVNTLKMALWRDNGNPGNMPTISLYSWQDKSWTTIQDPIQGTNLIQKAGPYVNEAGTVRVQLATENDTFGCIYIDLGLEAEPAGKQGG